MARRPSRATVAGARGCTAIEQRAVAAAVGCGRPRSAPWATELIAATNAQLARVNGTRRCEFAGIKMETLDVNHSRIEVGIRLQKFSQRLRGDVPATRDRNVRMPWSKIWLEARSECRLLHSLVNLKQVRMRAAHADPNNFRRTLCRKRSDSNNGEEKSAKLDSAELFSQGNAGFIRHVAKKT